MARSLCWLLGFGDGLECPGALTPYRKVGTDAVCQLQHACSCLRFRAETRPSTILLAQARNKHLQLAYRQHILLEI